MSLRWRLGLQAMLSLTILAFFLGLFFRPASLYHPQRDAISHIKHQKEKVKGINTKEKLKQKKKASLLLDISFMRNRSIRIFLVCSSISSLGIYTPLFYLVGIDWDNIIYSVMLFDLLSALPHVFGECRRHIRQLVAAPVVVGVVNMFWVFAWWGSHYCKVKIFLYIKKISLAVLTVWSR